MEGKTRSGPGFYSEIGKKARDLLYKDYQTDQKFAITTYTANGIALTTSSTKRNELILGEIQSQIKSNNISISLIATSESKVLTTVTLDDFGAPGLKTVLSFMVPSQRSGMLELQYLHDYAAVSAGMSLTANPVVNLATVVGSNAIALGADVAFDSATGNFTKCNAGLNVVNADLIASLTVNEKGESMTASYYHLVSPLTATAVGAELTHSFTNGDNAMTFGTQHLLDPLTLVKARFNNYGMASALIQHEWRPKSFFTISGEVDTKAIEKSSKVGLSLVLLP
ncbi:mitochondrial outer membrane protein porin 1-like protein [Carex littledalei]|uniref:Mitochondrial outer membrane protein porin 1-like protein n=1 Tax=Carex littledalei TaxID=544730 RepID=A0A833QYH2_9POAL|nr:mitochondrial outer membrane protein porin 1-like protein [Carex littledalei]